MFSKDFSHWEQKQGMEPAAHWGGDIGLPGRRGGGISGMKCKPAVTATDLKLCLLAWR